MRRFRPLLPLLLFFAAPSLAAKTYPASGLILQIDRAHLALKISCQAIPGYKAAAVVTLPVHGSQAFDGLRAGVLIDFVVSVESEKTYAEQIRMHRFENTAAEPMAARQLEIVEAATSGDGHAGLLQAGSRVPDFTLIDQQRRKITFSQFNGKVVAITFIYTKCPLPNFCFRMSNNFSVLHRRFAQSREKDLVLLSISFDPEHDQPEVLAQYARMWTKDATGWHFLTGPLADVQRVCRSFGVNFWQDEGLLTHSLHTIVVDRDGRIFANLEGNEYTSQQLGDLVETVLAQ